MASSQDSISIVVVSDEPFAEKLEQISSSVVKTRKRRKRRTRKKRKHKRRRKHRRKKSGQAPKMAEVAISVRESLALEVEEASPGQEHSWYQRMDILAFISIFLTIFLLVLAAVYGMGSSTENSKLAENLDSYFVELEAEPKNLRKLSHDDLIIYIEETLLPKFQLEHSNAYTDESWSTGYYKKTRPCARKFIRYIQVLLFLEYEFGVDCKEGEKFRDKNQLGFKRGEEKRLNDKYVDLLAAENKKRRVEFKRLIKNGDSKDAKKYGSMTLAELHQCHPRDGFSKPEWIRPHNFKLFNKEIKYEDVTQGNKGTCWLLSSLQSLAVQRPDHIREMITPGKNGLYNVTLFINGKKRIITVDTFFEKKRLGRNYIQDHPTHWALLVEKAFAKYYNDPSYNAIDGNVPSLAFRRLTAYNTSTLYTGEYDFGKLQKYWNEGYLMYISGLSKFTDGEGHGWSIVGFETESGVDYVHISNPHNNRRERAVKEYAKDYPECPISSVGYVEGTKSTLRMPFDQIAKCYESVTVCMYNKNISMTHLTTNNRGTRSIDMDVYKITCDKAGKADFEIFVDMESRKDEEAGERAMDGELFVINPATDKANMTCGTMFSEELKPENEYYYLPYFTDEQYAPNLSLNISISSKLGLTIEKMSADDANLEDLIVDYNKQDAEKK